MDTPPQPAAPTASPLRRAWRIVKIIAVTTFVVWHLFFLTYRNFADLWGEEVAKKAAVEKTNWETEWKHSDGGRLSQSYAAMKFWQACFDVTEEKEAARITRRYGAFLGQEQGWCMFAAPLARKAFFPAVRIHFSDGSTEDLHSGNEPDPNSYRRFGGFRQRKLEDYIAYGNAQGEEAAVWSNYTLWVYRHWRAAHPDDHRELKWLQLRARRIDFPAPDQQRDFPEPDSWEIALYDADGRWVR
jgi:hypothetical protein